MVDPFLCMLIERVKVTLSVSDIMTSSISTLHVGWLIFVVLIFE